MEKLIFVGSSWVFAKYIALSCQLLGFQPVFLGNSSFYSSDVRSAVEQCEYYDVDIHSVDDMYNLIKSKNIDNIAGITTSYDSALTSAISLAKRLNVKGPDTSILALANKYNVTQLVPDYSPDTLVFKKSDIPFDKIKKLFKKHQMLILKPTHGAGAIGVKKIGSVKDINSIPNYLKEFKESTWVIQQGIEGELYSIEGYCLNGKVNVLGFSLRDRVKKTEMANHFPTENFISDDVRNNSLQALKQLVTKSGYQNGYFHCEFLSDGRNVYLIDANFGRVGGAALIEQLATSFDNKPEEITAHIISVSLFGHEPAKLSLFKNTPEKTLSLYFGLGKAAHYRGVIKPVLSSPYYAAIANENTYLEAIGEDDFSWVGILSGPNHKVLKDIQNFKIKTDKGLVPATYFVRHDLTQIPIAK
tara:strand:+ start:619 stop:1866 length:1248 start_codon:yes stop_codon:yes gene_type:complete